MKYEKLDKELIETKHGKIEICLFDDGIRLPRISISRINEKHFHAILGSMTFSEAKKVSSTLNEIIKRNERTV